MKFRNIVRWIARRSVLIFTFLVIAIAVALIWLLVVSVPFNVVVVSIGIAAVSAVFAAISAIASLVQAAEVQKQRESQEQPYVISYFDGANSGAICFVIENCGNSPAKNISIRFSPSPIDYAGRPLTEVSFFRDPIDFLPPGKKFRQIIDAGHRFFAEGKPTRFHTSLSYESIYNDSYNHSMEHDLEYLKQATLPEKSINENLSVISEQLKSLVEVFENAQGKLDRRAFLVESLSNYQTRTRRVLMQDKDSPRWKVILRQLLETTLSKLD